MTESWTKQVANKQNIEERSLHGQYIKPLEKSWLLQFQENKQVKSLVVSLLQQMVNPAFIPPQVSYAFQVPGHSTDHARYSRDRFEKNTSLDPFSDCHPLYVIRSQKIIGPSNGPDKFVCNPIPKRFRLEVLYFYLLGFTFGIDIVGHTMVGCVINSLSLRQGVEKGLNFFHLTKIIEKLFIYKNLEIWETAEQFQQFILHFQRLINWLDFSSQVKKFSRNFKLSIADFCAFLTDQSYQKN